MIDNNVLTDVPFISIESFYPDGRGVCTPVWNIYENGELYTWTEADSYKVKRIRENSYVRICESNAAGKPLSDWIDASAEVLETKEETLAQRKRMAGKYSVQFWGFYLLGWMRRRECVVLKITLQTH